MRKSALLFLLTAALIPLGCSRVSVHTMADPEVDFTRYATYKILPKGGAQVSGAGPARRRAIWRDPLYHSYVHDALGTALREKGLRPVPEAREADLVIAYQTTVQTHRDVLPPVYGVGWRGHVYVRHPARVRTYKEGTFVIDIVDGRERHLVWRGVGVGAMRDMRPGEPLTDAVREILAEFPPE
jgi:hypothetical protein